MTPIHQQEKKEHRVFIFNDHTVDEVVTLRKGKNTQEVTHNPTQHNTTHRAQSPSKAFCVPS